MPRKLWLMVERDFRKRKQEYRRAMSVRANFGDVARVTSEERTMAPLIESRILFENYHLPGDLERTIPRRYRESLDDLTPADLYFGQGTCILQQREDFKRKTIEKRQRLHLQAAT